MNCVICGEAFAPIIPKNKQHSPAVTCSRSCAVRLSWKKNPEKRIASLKAKQSTPEARARTIEVNNRRWSDPVNRERLSQWNKERWADASVREEMSAAIRRVWSDPNLRARASEIKRAAWQDPVIRARMHDAAMTSQKTQAYREVMRGYAKSRWANPLWREKYTQGIRRAAQNPIKCEKHRQVLKKRWANPQWREKMLAILWASRRPGYKQQAAAQRLLAKLNAPRKLAVVRSLDAVRSPTKQQLMGSRAPGSSFSHSGGH